jgi:hypothetical protein
MLHHRSYRRAATLLLLAILTSWLPSAATEPWSPDTPGTASAAAAPPTDSSQTRLTAAAVSDPHLPSLTIEIGLAPELIALGDTAVLTITLSNGAPDPALDLVVTLATPDGAVAEPGPNTISPTQGWQWTLPRLEQYSSASFTGALRVVRMPKGNALLLRPEATARTLIRGSRSGRRGGDRSRARAGDGGVYTGRQCNIAQQRRHRDGSLSIRRI